MNLMKLIRQHKYAVSFNTSFYEIGGYEDGDTVDYIGNDVAELAKEVLDDSHYSDGMIFVSDEDVKNGNVPFDDDAFNAGAVGYFTYDLNSSEPYVVAVMYEI